MSKAKSSAERAIERIQTAEPDGDFYRILGIPETANEAEIRESFRTAVDALGSTPDQPMLAKLHGAYSVLHDPRQRRRYDAWLEAQPKTQNPLPFNFIPDGTHYQVLNVPRTSEPDEIQRAYRVAIAKAHPDAGGSNGAAARVNLAWEVLGDFERRSRYDLELDGDTAPRFTITGFGDQIPIHTGDVKIAIRWQSRGLTVTDNLPGEPGGLGDETVTSRFEVKVPAGRRWAGEDRIDSYGQKFIKGTAYLNDPDALIRYRRLHYEIRDRGAFDQGDNLQGWCVWPKGGEAPVMNGNPGGNALRRQPIVSDTK